MSPARKPQRKFSTRPFAAAVLLLFALAASVYISNTVLRTRRDDSSSLYFLSSRDTDVVDVLSKKNRECRELHHAKNKCKYVRKYCEDENAGLIPYLSLYYCDLGNLQPLAFVILVAWTGMLFSTIGIAASDFFSINLSTIASVLGLGESLAGVTFLAFGNGSPDVFSTFAAMGSNSSSMAVGELIGAAGFITAVVAGSMALVREFKVSKDTYIRDICFFILAATFTFALLLDGNLRPWECASMIGFYIFYVVTVVSWHWYTTRRKRRRALEAASRSNFLGVGASDLEPYRDDDNGEDCDVSTGRVGRRRAETPDVRSLDEIPRIDLEAGDDDPYEVGDAGIHVAAEMTSNMRVTRPRGRRSTTTITPIRPSLVGALEFRSVLSSLQRERNLRMRPINILHARSYSVNHIGTSVPHIPVTDGDQTPQPPVPFNTPEIHSGFQPGSLTRDRALSSGDVPRRSSVANLVEIMAGPGGNLASTPLLPPPGQNIPQARSPSPSASFKVGGKLAPPPMGSTLAPGSPSLQLEIPGQTPPHSEASSPTLSPFPQLVESPMPLSPNLPPYHPLRSHHYHTLPSPSIEPSNDIDVSEESPKPVKWWPYEVLPAPHLMYSTFFPTLQGWYRKSVWDKFASVISVPSVFLLIITLPVVETDSFDDGSVNGGDDLSLERQYTAAVDPVTVVPQETEWQRYRRSTQTRNLESPQSSLNPSPLLISVESPQDVASRAAPNGSRNPLLPAPSMAKSPSVDGTSLGVGNDNVSGWSRWLVAVQIVMGPIFAAFILWANLLEDLETPGKSLFRMLLYAWLISLVLLGLLFMTTSPDKKPRFHYCLCFLGFIVSIAWISTVAGEVVGVLKAIGVILDISEAILGLTIFAVGNSLGDLVADITVARLGYPVMALSACFGGPMLNILLGIGLGGLFYSKGLQIEVGATLIVSAISLLITLLALLVVVPLNNWVLSRRIGWGLIGLWSLTTISNLIIELSGIWKDVQ